MKHTWDTLCKNPQRFCKNDKLKHYRKKIKNFVTRKLIVNIIVTNISL